MTNEKARNTLALFRMDSKPELRSMCRYIELTDGRCLDKPLYSSELKTLFILGQGNICDAIAAAYTYGQAKGFRRCQELNRETEH